MATREEVAGIVDHTLLKPEATIEDVKKLVEAAKELGTYSVCVSPSMLPLPEEIELGDVKLAVVAGFPSGAVASEIKAAEAARAVAAGADEVDMVINIGLAKEGAWEELEYDIAVVRDAIPYAVLKVIIESAALTDEEIVKACEASMNAGADFVKTSTGFHPTGGASVHAVEIMKRTVGDALEIKASGGIHDGAFALELMEAGATRLGLSGTAKVLDSLPE
ncbi:deoxyribose-phosphate aldolase [Arcanobacterium haemolyticum]|uniref:Deoxyribose-phosphate aldolase n=1 Tax=Arcanobacterium haemolyticum (strain ATCC 9345 / DSM 20595 / CCM 5947 / CCUG 17215 / LMG 16163 / NBRC 15585 / NCTC 8452 / 11018) TaxID=644284 RepID=D7BJY9_ARCHD|nr:deoxyribose-phosphate aldolase [Arcanobacterium haemolyticum DSM 20595]QCX47040.1 deoxyribose-phosphate aldolase [Arcanobacterium haemolyticum]SQH28275.1 Deoxyribose-phosphate aldolase [Arcanobacterium haemolyticum]